MIKLLLALLLSISQCLALDVIPIQKGTPAPQDGYFLTKDSEKEMRKINEERKLLKKENMKLQDLAVINEDRIDTYKEYAETAEKQSQRERRKGFWRGAGGFVLGVLATSLASYAAIKATK